MIRRNILLVMLSCLALKGLAQDAGTTLKAAENLEKQQKETEALEKYKSVAEADTTNLAANLKTAELSCAVGARINIEKNKTARQPYYQQAQLFATRALAIKPDDAQVNYVMSLVCAKMTEVEPENKKVTAYVRQSKEYADKALAINPAHGKANYMEGKWNMEMLNMGFFKKAAAKTIYGGLPSASLDSAIIHLEKCRVAEPYFVQNYLDLAKAYKQDNKPAKAIEVLNRLVKLPIRTADDAALKAEGKQMLDEML